MYKRIALIYILSLLFSSCTELKERLSRLGQHPKFTNIEIPPIDGEDDIFVSTGNNIEGERQMAHVSKTNSLWQPGSIKFFKDSRVWNVGDIIKVLVHIKDSANLNNSTQHKRDGKDSIGLPKLWGVEDKFAKLFSEKGDPKALISANSSRNHSGNGNIARKEDIKTEIAAIVTKVLSNGNLIIQGHQEIMVNYELREIKIAGIIRPKDITTDNSINTNQIAEARISYGGRGIVSDVQQPRIGSQIFDIVAPF